MSVYALSPRARGAPAASHDSAEAMRLVISGVSKSFGSMRAVKDVSLSAAQGETIVLLGSSGCGKTTLLRMIAGFSEPDSGSITIDGAMVAGPDVFIPPERRGLSMVFQNYAVWPHKTVGENLSYGLRLKGQSKTEVQERVAAGLEIVRMAAYVNRFPGELSGGQQQRVALARALVLEPRLLLFDEPLSNLDATLREHMRFEIRAILDKLGITSLYVTHDQEEAMVVGNRIAVMNAGCIEQLGTAEEIYGTPQTPFVASFVGVSNKLKGSVVASGEGERLVEVEGLGRVAVSSSEAIQARDLCLYVRPHDIDILPAGAQSLDGKRNTYPGIVEQSTFLGSSTDLVVRINSVTLRVTLPARAMRPKAQQAVSVHLDSGAFRVLPA